MHEETILGIDVGTSSIKCSLFDYTGKETFTSNSEYSLLNPMPGVFEIDTEVLWNAVIDAIKKSLSKMRKAVRPVVYLQSAFVR